MEKNGRKRDTTVVSQEAEKLVVVSCTKNARGTAAGSAGLAEGLGPRKKEIGRKENKARVSRRFFCRGSTQCVGQTRISV